MPHSIRDAVDAGENAFGELIDVQHAQLVEWQFRLSPNCFNALVEHCNKLNLPASRNGFHRVPRGSDLTDFVAQWSLPRTSCLK